MVGLEVGILRAADERRDGRRGLRALGEPVVDARDVEPEVRILHLGVVPAEDLEELAVARATRVGRHYSVGRVVCATGATHSEFYHCVLPSFVG